MATDSSSSKCDGTCDPNIKFDPTKLKDDDEIWSFGYGSNMDVESVQAKKGIQILGTVHVKQGQM